MNISVLSVTQNLKYSTSQLQNSMMLAVRNVIQLIIRNYFHHLAHQLIPIPTLPLVIALPVNARHLLEVAHQVCVD